MADRIDFSTAAARARLGASGLALGGRLDAWSLFLVTLALLGLLWAARQSVTLLSETCMLISVLAGGVQKVLALRVAFDAAIFRGWAERWNLAAAGNDDPVSAIATDLFAFDRALAAIGLRTAADDPVRDLDSRLRGAWRLLRWQLIVFAVQFVALIVAVLAMCLSPSGCV